MVDLFNAMRVDTRGKLATYTRNLQSRFGDPRVYEAQREEQARMEAATVHRKSRETSRLLENAYVKQTQENRRKHAERMSKFRNYRAEALPPQSQGNEAAVRNSAPPEQESLAQPKPDSSPPETSHSPG